MEISWSAALERTDLLALEPIGPESKQLVEAATVMLSIALQT